MASSSRKYHLPATAVLLAVGLTGVEVVVAKQAWPWAKHCCHRKVIVAFVLVSAEQVPPEPMLTSVVIVEAKYPGCTSNRHQS